MSMGLPDKGRILFCYVNLCAKHCARPQGGKIDGMLPVLFAHR